MKAEMTALQNELDPHFVFNSLNALNQLILTNAEKAYEYNSKLAHVFKYLLKNKNKELIELNIEIEFLENYFALLQVMHEDKLELKIENNSDSKSISLVPPCCLQLLIENAIKHNEFTIENPMMIEILISKKYLKVINPIRPKPYMSVNTRIGLNNLKSRYRMVSNQEIFVESGKNKFLVELPLIYKV